MGQQLPLRGLCDINNSNINKIYVNKKAASVQWKPAL